jgi:DNA-binding CsgD family transcriptional regulator
MLIPPPPTAPDPDDLADPLVDAHCRDAAKRNRRTTTSLLAWAEVLDTLGWSVALRLPGANPTLSRNARKWAAGQACEAVCWAAITAHVSHANAANILISTHDVKVWLETEALPRPNEAKRPCEILTKRESEIFGWLREGKSGPEIAIILGCAQRTVESHVARLYRKLGVRNRAQLHFQSRPVTP